MKQKLITFVGWTLLLTGIGLYIYPVYLEEIGSRSGLVAFVIIFAGISLLKYRKDQINESLARKSDERKMRKNIAD